jgi:hypothetical protein
MKQEIPPITTRHVFVDCSGHGNQGVLGTATLSVLKDAALWR